MFEASNGVKVGDTAGHYTLHVTTDTATYNIDLKAEHALREYFEANPRPKVAEEVRQDLMGILAHTKSLLRDWDREVINDPEYVMQRLEKMGAMIESMHEQVAADYERYQDE